MTAPTVTIRDAPTIAFYRSLGAVPMDGWSVFRLDGDPLTALGSPDS